MSLRARLLLGARRARRGRPGCVAGFVTYASEHTFLLGRVDQQLSESARSRIGRRARCTCIVGGPRHGRRRRVDGAASARRRPRRPGGRDGASCRPAPSASYATRARGEVVADELRRQRREPVLPAIPTELHDRLAQRSRRSRSARAARLGTPVPRCSRSPPTSAGTVVVAVPLSDTDATLSRLRSIELIVIGGGAARARGCSAWWLVRVGLRPLDRWARPPARSPPATSRAGSARPTSAPRSGGWARAERDARPDRAGLRRARGERGAAAALPRRRLARAAHAARPRSAATRSSTGCGAAREPARGGEGDGADRGGGGADGRASSRTCWPWRGSTRCREPAREPLDLRALVRDAADDARAAAPDREIAVTRDGGPVRRGRRRRAAPGPRQPAAQRARPHAGRDADRAHARATRDGYGRDRGARPRPGPARGRRRTAVFERFWRAERGRERGTAGAGLGLAIVAAIVDAHGGQRQRANAPGGGAQFVIELPARARGAG